MKTLFWIIIILSIGTFAQISPASDISPSAISENVEFVGATGGSINDIFVQDNYAYICAGGILIFDVSVPSNPTKVGYVALPDGPSGAYVSGSLAYVVVGGVHL